MSDQPVSAAKPVAHPIERILVHRASVPLETAYRWSVGHYFGATKGIVEVRTTTGLTGLGEIADVAHCELLESMQAPQLLRDHGRVRQPETDPPAWLRRSRDS